MSFIETEIAIGSEEQQQQQQEEEDIGVTIEEFIKVRVPLTGGKYANKVYPLTNGEYEALKQSIKDAKKLHIPISINKHGDVLDGHHRLRACTELGIEPTFEAKHFK